jgi:hypothetical protein
MHIRHMRQLILEGAVITFVGASGIVIAKQATSSLTAQRLATVPFVGTAIKGLNALFQAV